jgi:hypothetical protein
LSETERIKTARFKTDRKGVSTCISERKEVRRRYKVSLVSKSCQSFKFQPSMYSRMVGILRGRFGVEPMREMGVSVILSLL